MNQNGTKKVLATELLQLTSEDVKKLFIDVKNYQRGPHEPQMQKIRENIEDGGRIIEPIHVNRRGDDTMAVIEGGQRTRVAVEQGIGLTAVLYENLTVKQEAELFDLFDRKARIQAVYHIIQSALRGHNIAVEMIKANMEDGPAKGRINIAQTETGAISRKARNFDPVNLLAAWNAYKRAELHSSVKRLLDESWDDSAPRFRTMVNALAELHYGGNTEKNPERGVVIGLGRVFRKESSLKAMSDSYAKGCFRKTQWEKVELPKSIRNSKDRAFSAYVIDWYDQMREREQQSPLRVVS